MTAFIDLKRRFRDLNTDELEEPELLAALNDREFGSPTGWPELLQHRRVLLLAEAGSGKTIEMREQAKRLTDEGKFAFFVGLESLDREPLVELLSAAEEQMFEAWKASGHAPGWFFLDAVDELKLTAGKLDRALLKFSKAVDGHLDRAHVHISSRPYDWRPTLDLATVQNRLPIPEPQAKPIPPPDKVFLEVLNRERGGVADEPAEDEHDQASNGGWRTVVLLPMSDRQIKQFAECSGVQDAAALLTEIGRQNAWAFSRRPLDLSELITTWKSLGRLGTLAQQHEANISAKLKDDPDRPDRGVLTDSQAQLGSERLALALALTRTRTIRSPDQELDRERADGVLDAGAILRDWSEEERQVLLRRALFDPATYGRVRFHHRSVQEFLAARRLKGLRDKGMSTKALFRLLFAQRYGVEVVIPSMRVIAAWLALWDEAVRRELTNREPEALLSLGDPESLDLAARAELVRAFVAAYGKGGWRGLNIPLREVRRLAHPELAPIIRELWSEGPDNVDVRELLINIIWQGAIDGCADLALAAALNVTWGDYLRVAAVQALLACGRDAAVREIADAMLADPASWPDDVVRGLAAHLFPGTITVDELIRLIERTREPKRSAGGLEWVMRQIVESIEPSSDQAIVLRDRLADLVWRGRSADQEPYCIRGRFGYLAPALALLCERQLAAAFGKADTMLVRASVIGTRFGNDEIVPREPVNKLKQLYCEDSELRRDAFWSELAFMDEVCPTNDDSDRLYHAENDSLIGHLTVADWPWLVSGCADESQSERRPVALHALIRLWNWRGRNEGDLEAIRDAIKDDVTLEAVLTKLTAPPQRNSEFEKIERSRRQRQRVQAERESQRLETWKNWREELLADPAAAFAADKCFNTVVNLYTWLRALHRARNRYDIWDKDALTHAFSASIADRAEDALRVLWRGNPPTLWSARPPEERNGTRFVWIYGLCGLSAESSTPGWTERLSSQEVRTAAVYATIELNGFASFITDLVKSHPAEVDEVLGKEIDAMIRIGGEHSYLPILQDLSYADSALKCLLAPRLFNALPACPTTFTAESGPRWAHHLDHVLRILYEADERIDGRTVADECANRYEADSVGPVALVWLRGLFRFDAQRGTDVLTGSLAATSDPAVRERAIETFAALFGDRDAIVFEIADPAQRARALGRLIRCAFAFVRCEDDEIHEGVYSPSTRDHAEMARGFLLSTLLDTPGPEARRLILDLSAEPDFAHFPDRLRLLARQRAAEDAEFSAFDPAAIVVLESRYESPPHTRDGLFDVMMDRLDDLAHDISQYDFTDRRTLRTISDETEMQRTLAWRIDAKANGAFVVTREDEVADRKRTDIRLSAVIGDQKAVIEVKLADRRWSLNDLEQALRDQLMGRYLRHRTCRAGCLLLTYDGQKKFWLHPETRKRLTFADIVAFLNERAQAMEIESGHSIRLATFGFNLTDPMLASAHRKSAAN